MTAWTQRPEDEHRLLSALMVTFLRHEIVPPELLDGSLADLGISIPIAVALPPPQDRALSDVWSALGGELKPSLDVTLIAPLLPERFAEVGPPVRDEPVLGRRPDVGADESDRRRPADAAGSRPRRRRRPTPAAATDARRTDRRRAGGHGAPDADGRQRPVARPPARPDRRRADACRGGRRRPPGGRRVAGRPVPRSVPERRAGSTRCSATSGSGSPDDVAGERRRDVERRRTTPRRRAPSSACAQLAARFDLDDLDVELLLTAIAPDVDDRFERYYGYLNDDVTRRRASVGLALGLAGVAAASAAGRDRFEPGGRLVASAG